MKLKNRIFITTSTILLISLLVAGFVFSFFLYHFLEKLFIESELKITKNIADNLVQNFLKYSSLGFSGVTKNTTSIISGEKDLLDFIIVDMNGKILFSLNEIENKTQNLYENRFIDDNTKLKAQSLVSSYYKIFKDKQVSVQIIQPIFDFYQRHLYSVIFYYSLKTLKEKSIIVFSTFILIFFIFLIINYFSSILLTNYITNPLYHILDNIKKWREEKSILKIEPNFDYEFNLLTSEFKQMMRLIRDERTLIINSLYSLKTGILIINKDFHIILCNKAFCDLLSTKFLSEENFLVEQNSLFEKNIYCFQLFPQLEKFKQSIIMVLEDKITRNFSGEIFPQLPSNYFNLEISPLVFEENSIAVLLRLDDITENKQIEKRLVQLQKGELINSLASGLAHDFNNLIGSIKSTATIASAEIIEKKIEKISEISDYLDIIYDIAKSAENIVKHLLSLSKHKEITKDKVDLIDIIDKVIKICKISVDKSVEIKFTNYVKSSCTINADEILLEEVFFNLIINASHSMTIMRKEGEKWGGIITIELSHIDSFSLNDLSKEYFIFNSEENIQKVLSKPVFKITISDNGVGIEKENFKKIFKPFFSTKPDNYGTGLGLSMVLTLIELHKGILDLKSELNSGSTFSIFLPSG